MTSRPARLLAALGLALAVLCAGGSLAHAAADTTRIRPGQLERGDDPGVTTVLGTTILDGTTRIAVDADEIQLLGGSLDDYVAVVYDANGSAVQRIAEDGTRTTLVQRVRGDFQLSQDGERLVQTRNRGSRKALVQVRDAVTGNVVARHRFRGFVAVLDADGDRVLLGGSAPDRTLSWASHADEVTRVAGKTGYFADLRADRLAVFTDDAYDGGCSALSTVTNPHRKIWRSCSDAVIAAAPNGRRVVTVALLQDGPIGQVSVRKAHGRLLDRYRLRGEHRFGGIQWETRKALLVGVVGPKRSTVVRCEGGDCERASRRARTL